MSYVNPVVYLEILDERCLRIGLRLFQDGDPVAKSGEIVFMLVETIIHASEPFFQVGAPIVMAGEIGLKLLEDVINRVKVCLNLGQGGEIGGVILDDRPFSLPKPEQIQRAVMAPVSR